MTPKTAAAAAGKLLSWYDRHARAMPWRIAPHDRMAGVLPDPYHVWLSEVMLQQTQVATVIPYFHDFTRRWPVIEALAAAPQEAVMQAWAGLGYYSRARNLKKCADEIASRRGGRFPQTAAELKLLPGIGDYTSAAIAAIAFDEPAAVVDGNVERVMARLLRLETPMPLGKDAVRAAVSAMVPRERPGDFAQAMMDLGATVCTPRKPVCLTCPLSPYCAAQKLGDQEAFPRKAQKAAKPSRVGAVFVIRDREGRIFLERRSESGMLAGMAGLPTTDWSVRSDGATGMESLPFKGEWRAAGLVSHAFTHFDLRLEVWLAERDRDALPLEGWWAKPEALSSEALPTVMKKALVAAIPSLASRFAKGKNRA